LLLGAAPPRPADCREVAAGADLAGLLAAASPGERLCLAPGAYTGPLRLDGVTVWGPRDAVIRSTGEGTTVRLIGQGPALLGVTIDGSGGRFDLLDAAVHVAGLGARVEGVAIRNATFGILVEKAEHARVLANEVRGDPTRSLGLRGDGIRLWESYDCVVADNQVHDGRDMVLWYASRNRVSDNTIEGGRYGAHLMYSHDNELVGNRFVHNVTGLFVMYSRQVSLHGNLFAGAGGAAGIGLGLKESGNVTAIGNQFVRNTVGLYIDTSPLWPDDRNRFEGNSFRLNEVAVSFLGRASGNAFVANEFLDSRTQVEVDGHGDARAAEWRGNRFDDYAGYDLDGDGTGDVPYELRSLAADLVAAHPELAFYRGTLALSLAEAIGRIVPLLEPRLVLVDPQPRMRPLAREDGRAH
ncbi:MAG: nitrous oxide reductase family maturation protein NosD, partial [Deltaproteobacteria bacterium]|nr:nitrous oxide reductase family maturation protein NosD [Deltaproteobacteria bacterium]